MVINVSCKQQPPVRPSLDTLPWPVRDLARQPRLLHRASAHISIECIASLILSPSLEIFRSVSLVRFLVRRIPLHLRIRFNLLLSFRRPTRSLPPLPRRKSSSPLPLVTSLLPDVGDLLAF